MRKIIKQKGKGYRVKIHSPVHDYNYHVQRNKSLEKKRMLLKQLGLNFSKRLRYLKYI